MPNWCSNSVTLRGESTRIRELADAFKRGEFCSAVIPIPAELQNPDTGSYGGEDADAKDRLREALTKKYGYSGWYDFCVGRWGTKWDVGDEHSFELSEDGTELRLNFDSAWAPPQGVYEALHEEGIDVDAFYYESGMGFCGRYFQGTDNYYELNNMNSAEVAETLDPDIDEMFGISESMAEYEEEQRMEDELYRWTKEGGEKLELKAA